MNIVSGIGSTFAFAICVTANLRKPFVMPTSFRSFPGEQLSSVRCAAVFNPSHSSASSKAVNTSLLLLYCNTYCFFKALFCYHCVTFYYQKAPSKSSLLKMATEELSKMMHINKRLHEYTLKSSSST